MKVLYIVAIIFVTNAQGNGPCRGCNCPYGYKLLKETCECKCNTRIGDLVYTSDVMDWVMAQESGVETKAAAKIIPKWTEQQDEKGFYVLPFYFSADIMARPEHKNAILKALSVINAISCIKFSPAQVGDPDIVEFILGGGCYSHVGRSGKLQRISIGNGCQSVGIVLHEAFHALGFWHEQNRADRDEFVKVNLENVRNGFLHNFYKRLHSEVISFDSPYDFQSIMHYSSYAFTKNGSPTLVLQSSEAPFSVQRVSLSKEDQHQLLSLYSCGNVSGIQRDTDCFHPMDSGFSYRGNVSVTKTGIPCQRWDSNTPHVTNYSPSRITGAGLDGNSCRNPDIGDGGLWCYTTDSNKRWEYCNVPMCSPAVGTVEEPEVLESRRGFWSDFGNWGSCSATCGNGTQYRFRQCLGNSPGSEACPGESFETRSCANNASCPTGPVFNGTWSNWTSSSCTRACGNGRRFLARICSGGICHGDPFKIKSCSNKKCPLYKGGKCFNSSDVGGYRGRISVSKSGTKCLRWKRIFNPLPSQTADLRRAFCRNPDLRPSPYCYVTKNVTEKCSVPPCVEDAKWSAFSNWSSCTKSCGVGLSLRVRSCIGGFITQGSCIGKVLQRKRCNKKACPVEPTVAPTNSTPTVTSFTTPVPVTPKPANATHTCSKLNEASLYRGNISTSYEGHQCQHWDAMFPHTHEYTNLEKRAAVGLSENFCRAPEPGDAWPWCFVVAYNIRKQYCDVPLCLPDPIPPQPPVGCYQNARWVDYRGGQNVTASGHDCQRWDFNKPHAHLLKPYFYADFGVGAHNYCRSLGFDELWCYTTNPRVRYETCNVPVC